MWPNPRILFDSKLFRPTHETRNSTTFHSVSASPSRFWCCLSPPETLNTLFDTLEATGIATIDATQLHQGCESLLGNAHVCLNDLPMPTTNPPKGLIPGSLSNHPRLRSDSFQLASQRLESPNPQPSASHGPDPQYFARNLAPRLSALWYKRRPFSPSFVLDQTPVPRDGESPIRALLYAKPLRSPSCSSKGNFVRIRAPCGRGASLQRSAG